MKAMFKKTGKVILWMLGAVALAAIIFLIYFNLPVKKSQKNAELGVTYSARYAKDIGLDWKETLKAILDDLNPSYVRIPIYWDLSEPAKDVYDFSEIDWQLVEAERKKAKVVLVIGQKVPRWPECFIPKWIGDDEGIRKQELLEFINVVVNRYKGDSMVYYWQVENEPFLSFGVCPEIDSDLLDLEIATVRAVDVDRKIVVTDSGELSLWTQAAKRADIFGTTMYRSVVTRRFGGLAFNYPIGPNFFKFKYWLIQKFAKQENIMIVELQGEPWLDGWTTDKPMEEQLQSMNARKLLDNVEFAKKTQFSPIFIWGVEWWYWMKVSKNHPELWEEAIKIFSRQL